MVWTSHPVKSIKGMVRAPGDKSCSHRALILGGLAEGVSEFRGLLEGEDVLRTGDAMRALGAEVEQLGAGHWRVNGVGAAGLQSPAAPLDFGNSGTGSRLMMGAVTPFDLEAKFTGDASLSARPMDRILVPLRKMGLGDDGPDTDARLPVTLTGTRGATAIDYTPPMASAQVKSAILLAGLGAEGLTIVREPKATRDHTERMLVGFGAAVSETREVGGGRTVEIWGGQCLVGMETAIPGDPSSASFLAAAGIIAGKGNVVVEGVMSNDTRSGFFDVAVMMGAEIGAEDRGEAAGERIVDISATSSGLKGFSVATRYVPAMIDEFPILAVLAAYADGETIVSGAEELRVKETDRVTAIVDMLRANGVEAEERPDGFVVQGCGGPLPGGGLVETRHDHRIAMSALIMGLGAQKPVRVDDISMIATSYPDFLSHMQILGADIRQT